MGMDESMKPFETGSGLDLDPYRAQFRIESPLDKPVGAFGSPLEPISDRVRSEIAMVVYYEEMESIFRELTAIEQELLVYYEFCMGLRFNAYQVFELIEDLYIRFTELEAKLVAIRIPSPDGEFRPSDDDKVLHRNPLSLARL